jgi:hypothetical protein
MYFTPYLVFCISYLFFASFLLITVLIILNTLELKGQCHEMVVEVRPWSGSIALN